MNIDRGSLLTDIPSLMENDVISDAAHQGRWRSCPYKTAEFNGTMIACGENTAVRPAIIALNATGWFQISVGIFKVFEGKESKIRIRLSNDLCFETLSTSASGKGSDTNIYEIIWRRASLNGEKIIIEDEECFTGSLAFIRLLELSDEPTIKTKSSPRYPMAITEDGYGAFCSRRHRRQEDFLEFIDAIPADSAMKMLLWGITGADLCNYPTNVGDYDYGVSLDHPLRHQRICSENLQFWRENSWNSLEVVRDYAQKRGWEFHVSVRTQAFAAHFPFDEAFHSTFFQNHPEWRCRDEKGEMIGRMSYAYPEVRKHILDIIREILSYHPDGLNLIFTRGLPMVLYEPITREEFKAEYGIDPIDLPEEHPDWLEYKSGIVTGFITEVKRLLRGRERLSVFIPGTALQCRLAGFDIAKWVENELVDDLYPTGYHYDTHDIHRSDNSKLEIDFFLNLSGRDKVRLFPTLFGCSENDGERLLSFLNKGADGYCLWDGAHTPVFKSLYDLGDARCGNTAENDGVNAGTRKIPLLRLGDFRIDRYHQWECF